MKWCVQQVKAGAGSSARALAEGLREMTIARAVDAVSDFGDRLERAVKGGKRREVMMAVQGAVARAAALSRATCVTDSRVLRKVLGVEEGVSIEERAELVAWHMMAGRVRELEVCWGVRQEGLEELEKRLKVALGRTLLRRPVSLRSP